MKQHGEDTLYCYGHNQYERDKLANLNNEKLEGIKSCWNFGEFIAFSETCFVLKLGAPIIDVLNLEEHHLSLSYYYH